MEQEAGFSGLVVPRGTYYTCLALNSNGFGHPRPLSGVDTSVVVVGASVAQAFWWRRTPKSGVYAASMKI